MSRFLFLTFIACATTLVLATDPVIFSHQNYPEPFRHYGLIDPTHQQELPNYSEDGTIHYHYAVTNLPAQREETLYTISMLFTPTGLANAPLEFALHVVAPTDDDGDDPKAITYKKSVFVSGPFTPGQPIDISSHQLHLKPGYMLLISCPNQSLKLKVGPNNIGYPVPYASVGIASDQVAFVQASHHYDQDMVYAPDTTAPGADGSLLQLCIEYGTYDITRSNLIQWGSEVYVFHQKLISQEDGFVTSFKMGLSYTNGGADFNEVTGANVQLCVAKPVVGPPARFEIDITRCSVQNAVAGVQNGVEYQLDLDDNIPIAFGEMLGYRVISDAFNGLTVRGNWVFNQPFGQDVYYTFNAPNTNGATPASLVKYDNMFEAPNFGYTVEPEKKGFSSGDPQFAGFHGQSFQFHGLADEHFNLISSPKLQLNSHFVYLSSGKCDYNNTVCFQHPGTYVDALGFTIPSANGEVHIKMVAGSHGKGLRVWMGAAGSDLQEVSLGANPTGLRWSMANDTSSIAQLTYTVFGEASVRTPALDVKVINSDYFFNLEVSFLDHRVLRSGAVKHTITDHKICKQDREGSAHELHASHQHGLVEAALAKKYSTNYPLHGLIGQTWRNVMVCGKHWMGGVQDYVVSDLFGRDYTYQMYKGH